MKKVEVKVDPSLSEGLMVGGKIFRSASDFRVTERDLEKAQKELNETEEKRKIHLEELRRMLLEDKGMRYRLDDDYLLRFLRYRKFDLKKTYKLIQHFYTMRNEDPPLFTLPSDAEFKLEGKFNNMMPYTHDNGEMIFIHRIGHWNHKEVSVRDYCVMFGYVSDVTSMNPHAQIDGVIVMFDYGGMNAGLLSELLNPANIKFYMKFLQELYPWRVKKVIFFNVNAVLYASLYVVRCSLKKKIYDRLVVIQSDLKELHKHVNPAILPKTYGGRLDDEECFSYIVRRTSSHIVSFCEKNSAPQNINIKSYYTFNHPQ